jgi:hypothetical protein
MGPKGSFVRRRACARHQESALGTCRFSITASSFAGFMGCSPINAYPRAELLEKPPATTHFWDERHSLVFHVPEIPRCQEMTNWPEYNNLRRPHRLDNQALKALY